MASKTVSSGFNTKFSININGESVSGENGLTPEQKEKLEEAMEKMKEVAADISEKSLSGVSNIEIVQPTGVLIDGKDILKDPVVKQLNTSIGVKLFNLSSAVFLIAFVVYFVLKVVLKVW